MGIEPTREALNPLQTVLKTARHTSTCLPPHCCIESDAAPVKADEKFPVRRLLNIYYEGLADISFSSQDLFCLIEIGV